LANPRNCPFTDLSEDAASQLASMGVGTVVVVVQLPHSENITAAAARKVITIHRGERLLNIMVRKVDAESLLYTVRTILGIKTQPRDEYQKKLAEAGKKSAAAEVSKVSSEEAA
jgi:hypothetical protein